MSPRNERGFSLIEVMVAVVLLTIGLLALLGSSAMVTRMIGRGKASTIAVQTATQRIETLRQLAGSTDPACTAGGFVSGNDPDEQWVVEKNGTIAQVRAIVIYATRSGTRRDTLTTIIHCD